MSGCEAAVYGGKRGFVYLRYVAMVFFFLSQLATYYVVANVLEQVGNALNAVNELDIAGLIRAMTSFRIAGPFGTFIKLLQDLGALVVPLYFIATVSLVLNLNRRGMGKLLGRTALMAILMAVVEFFVYALLMGMVAVLMAALFLSIETQYADILGVLEQIVASLNTSFALPVHSSGEALELVQEFATMQISLALLRNMPSFNIFLDELLCLLMCCFFCSRPKWVNSKKRLGLFRALGALPILFIAATFVLNGLSQTGVIRPSLTLLSIFPAKKLPQFLFVGCILFLNRMQPVRELGVWEGLTPIYLSRREYRPVALSKERRADERRRTLSAAVFLSVCLLIICAADLSCTLLPLAAKWGLGRSYYAVLCIPFLFFFDDRRPTSKRSYNCFLAIYFAVILAIVLIYFYM